MNELLPGLLVAIPILGATLPLALGLARERIGWSVAAVVLAIETVLAAWLAYAVYGAGERIVHALGGEAFGRGGPENFAVGIELIGDALSAFVVLLIAFVSLAVLAFSRQAGPRSNAFYSGYLLLTGGLMGTALTGDLFNLFVFLEITGLATYALIASNRSGESALASLKYLIIGTAGASLYLVGVGYLYVRTGTLNMVDLSRVLAGEVDFEFVDGALYSDPLVVAGFGFIAVGLATKAAIYPLHTWQPDAYDAAPDAVTIYISALVSTVAAYAFGRITLVVFTPDFFAANPLAIEAVLVLAALSVVVGSALAAAQSRVKRMFAYSSVAQFGLIIAAFGIAVHPAAFEAGETAVRYAVYGAVIHLFAHAIIKGGLFATAGALAAGYGARTVESYAGLAKRAPYLSGAVAILGFAIVGVPPTVGFIGKWYIAVASVEAGIWWLVFVIFASTLLTMLYVARLLEKLYFDYLPSEAPGYAEPSADVAADGGQGTTPTADGGEAAGGQPTVSPRRPEGGLTLGMVAVAIGATVLAFALGFAGEELTRAVEPLAQAVIESSPEVTNDG